MNKQKTMNVNEPKKKLWHDAAKMTMGLLSLKRENTNVNDKGNDPGATVTKKPTMMGATGLGDATKNFKKTMKWMGKLAAAPAQSKPGLRMNLAIRSALSKNVKSEQENTNNNNESKLNAKNIDLPNKKSENKLAAEGASDQNQNLPVSKNNSANSPRGNLFRKPTNTLFRLATGLVMSKDTNKDKDTVTVTPAPGPDSEEAAIAGIGDDKSDANLIKAPVGATGGRRKFLKGPKMLLRLATGTAAVPESPVEGVGSGSGEVVKSKVASKTLNSKRSISNNKDTNTTSSTVNKQKNKDVELQLKQAQQLLEAIDKKTNRSKTPKDPPESSKKSISASGVKRSSQDTSTPNITVTSSEPEAKKSLSKSPGSDNSKKVKPSLKSSVLKTQKVLRAETALLPKPKSKTVSTAKKSFKSAVLAEKALISAGKINSTKAAAGASGTSVTTAGTTSDSSVPGAEFSSKSPSDGVKQASPSSTARSTKSESTTTVNKPKGRTGAANWSKVRIAESAKPKAKSSTSKSSTTSTTHKPNSILETLDLMKTERQKAATKLKDLKEKRATSGLNRTGTVTVGLNNNNNNSNPAAAPRKSAALKRQLSSAYQRDYPSSMLSGQTWDAEKPLNSSQNPFMLSPFSNNNNFKFDSNNNTSTRKTVGSDSASAARSNYKDMNMIKEAPGATARGSVWLVRNEIPVRLRPR